MKKLTFIALIFSIISCQQDKTNTENDQNKPEELVAKYDVQQNRAFRKKNSSYPTDTFDIDPRKDTLLLSQQGTLLEIPKNNFLDDKGELITSPIQIEWQDILTLEQAMDYGLSTVDTEGNILETGGMVYWDVSNENTKNVQLKAPIRIEIQSSLAQPELQQYEGDWKGDNLVWNNPKALEKTMSLVDLDALYGEDSQSLQQGYYNFHNKENTLPQKILIQSREPLMANCKVQYLMRSLRTTKDSKELIKATWIATQEFYSRYLCLMKACSSEGLELYIENTNLHLWQVDEKVAQLLEKQNNTQAPNFRKFAALKHSFARSNKPFSKSLIKKIKNNYQKHKNNEAFFSYPTLLLTNKVGYLNLDCLIKRSDLTITNCRVITKLNNQPVAIKPEVFIFLKQGQSIIPTDKIQSNYQRNFFWIPQDQKALFIAKSKDNKHIGWQEVVITDTLVETEITIKPIEQQGNYKAILKAYMNPDAQRLFTEQQEGACCQGYYAD